MLNINQRRNYLFWRFIYKFWIIIKIYDKGFYLLLAVWSFNVDKSKYGEERVDGKKKRGKLLIMLLDYIMANKTWNDQTCGLGPYALIFVLEKQNKNLFRLILILEKLDA